MNGPLLSIVIVNFNYGRFLEQAITSIVEQEAFDRCELIIVDGGSSDNSVEIIKKYDSRIAWWVSEKDKGQSDAFNKGFSHASGKYLTWLNADDILVKGCLKKVVGEMEKHPDCEWFTGNMFRFTEDGRVLECPWGPHCLPQWLQGRGQSTAVYGPTTFFSKVAFERVGRMKTYQNFMMDTDLWYKFYREGRTRYRRTVHNVFAYRQHEASKMSGANQNKTARALENRRKAVLESQVLINRHNLITDWRCMVARCLSLSIVDNIIAICRTIAWRGRYATEI